MERCPGHGRGIVVRFAARMAGRALLDRFLGAGEGLAETVTIDSLGRSPGVWGIGPFEVCRTGPVTGLAAHPDLAEGRGVAAQGLVIALLECGGMALGTARVPVLVGPGPVQGIIRRQVLVRVEVKPAIFLRVPDHIETLQPARPGLEQVLLQRFDAGHGVDAVVGCRPVFLGDGSTEMTAATSTSPRKTGRK